MTEPSPKPPAPILSWDQSIRNAVLSINTTIPSNICSYPIPALNETLGGILPGEVVVIAGQMGEGKSDFLRLTAEHNALKGRRVHVYQFEMDADENTRRFLLRRLNEVRKNTKNEPPITAVDLVMNNINPWDRAELERIAAEEAGKSFPLYTYGGSSMTCGEFLTHLMDAERPRMVILDHIHYFGGDSSDSENEATSKAMREIRQWTKMTGIPVILAAHMRKPSTKKDTDQTIHDIYGSSNIAKEATTCIIIRRGKGESTFSIWKSRVGADYKRFEISYDTAAKAWTGTPKNARTVFESAFTFGDDAKGLPF
jgi:replicative DNA helicase